MRFVPFQSFSRVVLTLCISFLCFACGRDQPSDSTSEVKNIATPIPEVVNPVIVKEQTWINIYKGTIASNKAITMTLINYGDGSLTGYYVYDEHDKKIDLFGDFQVGNSFTLEEYVAEDQTGIFTGKFIQEGGLEGTWQNPDSSKSFPFQLSRQENLKEPLQWSGTWHFNGIWDGGILIIGNESNSHFDFALSFTRSNHIGELSGTVAYQGNKAQFETNEFWEEICQLVFTLDETRQFIQINQLSDNTACGFGLRAYATGKYEREEKEMLASLSYGNADAVFESSILHDGFKKAVGAEIYHQFAYNMQRFDDYKVKDSFVAKAVSGMVIGLFNQNEAIIMYDKEGKFWAALLEGDETLEIAYYTNDANYKEQLPTTLIEWRENFDNPVVRFNYISSTTETSLTQ